MSITGGKIHVLLSVLGALGILKTNLKLKVWISGWLGDYEPQTDLHKRINYVDLK